MLNWSSVSSLLSLGTIDFLFCSVYYTYTKALAVAKGESFTTKSLLLYAIERVVARVSMTTLAADFRYSSIAASL